MNKIILKVEEIGLGMGVRLYETATLEDGRVIETTDWDAAKFRAWSVENGVEFIEFQTDYDEWKAGIYSIQDFLEWAEDCE